MIKAYLKQVLTGLAGRGYDKRKSLKKMTYPVWIRQREASLREDRLPERKAPEAQDPGKDDRPLVFYSEAGTLSETAERQIADFFRENPEKVLAYGDEDVRDPSNGQRRSPWFKPEWSPDTFCSFFYWGSVVAVRREWLERIRNSVDGEVLQTLRPEGGKELRELYRLSQELVLVAGGFDRGCRTIGHIPSILFHCQEEGQQEAFREFSCPAAGSDSGSGSEKVSVIIPSRDHPEVLEQCIASLIRTGGQRAFELILVDNGSNEENRSRIEKYLKTLPVRNHYLYRPMPFHFSRMCNLGAQIATGEYLLFLNDDIEMVCGDWLEKMLGKALLPYVGAVGMKLYYPEGRRIQHIGITNLPGGPVHKLQFMPDDRCYDFGRNMFDWNVLAVTGACMMCSAEKFRRAGGFCEELPVAYNDVDLCFRFWEQGYSNVVLNRIYAYHHESLSRGTDEARGRQDRLRAERNKLYERHPALLDRDPYFPEGLCREALDAGIRPAFVTAGNHPQELTLKKALLICGKLGKGEKEVLIGNKSLRGDDCLLIGIGRCDERMLEGFAVVTGDDNACYERILVLFPKGTSPGSAGEVPVYLQKLREQYRPDLEENMPQEKNVALCGFCLKWKNVIPEGVYHIGIIAHNRINGLRLLNWSSYVWYNF